MAVVAWLMGGILFVLSMIHLYWLSGGKWGMQAVIPIDGGQAAFQPSQTATALVAVLLAAAGWFVLELGEVVSLLYPVWLLRYGGWLLAAVFLMRAVGDFRLMGMFKKQQGSRFAQWDTRVYIPLCVSIALGVIVLTSFYPN